jgi:hypothetical protein
MVCLFHGDYGPADPGFVLGQHSWAINAHLLTSARNLGEAEAIQRYVLRGDAVSWCHQGYLWVDQAAIGWFYLAAFVFVVLPYLVWRVRNRFGGSPVQLRGWRVEIPRLRL